MNKETMGRFNSQDWQVGVMIEIFNFWENIDTISMNANVCSV